MNSSRAAKVFLGVAVVLTVMFLLFGAGTVGASDEGGWFDAWQLVRIVAPVVTLAGLYLGGHRAPLAGGALVLLGAVLMALSFYWFPPFWVAAVVVALIGITRAQRFDRTRSAL